MIKVLPSDPLFPEIDFIFNLYAMYKNPACYTDLTVYAEKFPLEFVADLQMIENEMKEMFEELDR